MASKGALALKLTANSNQTALTGDIVVKAGSTLFLDGAGRTIDMAQTEEHFFQFRVEARAKLCVYNLHLIGSSVRCFSDRNVFISASQPCGVCMASLMVCRRAR